MKTIQILGTGCSKCRLLMENTEEAVKSLGIEATIEKVDKIQDIMKFGVMTTPALVVDGAVKSAGKVLGTEDIKRVLQAAVAAALLLLTAGVARGTPVVVSGEPGTNGAAVVVKEASTNSVAAKALPRLVDLGAGRCIPCKKMAPILEDLKKAYAGKLDVQFIDVWKDRDAGKPYSIRLIPTQIFYDAAGKEVFRHEGFFSKDDILAKWKTLGVDLK